jgi:hypothetical protein
MPRSGKQYQTQHHDRATAQTKREKGLIIVIF